MPPPLPNTRRPAASEPAKACLRLILNEAAPTKLNSASYCDIWKVPLAVHSIQGLLLRDLRKFKS